MDYKKLTIRSISSIVMLSMMFFSTLNINILMFSILTIYIIIIIEGFFFFEKKKYLIIIYIFLSLLFIEYYLFNYYNFENFLLFIFLIISFDTYSYLFGTFLGKKKIAPNISPNKTFEGFFYGYILTIITFLFILYYFKLNFNIKILFFSNLILLFSFVGDLTESYFKRLSNIKNSSYFIPGHGGFFDRFDGFLFSVFLLPIWGQL